jgi:hypothetical protein
VTLRKHGRRRKNLHSIEDIGTGTPAAVTDRDWTREYDSKVYCEHCRNYRGPHHTAEHQRIVAEGGSWPKRRIAMNYWP